MGLSVVVGGRTRGLCLAWAEGVTTWMSISVSEERSADMVRVLSCSCGRTAAAV